MNESSSAPKAPSNGGKTGLDIHEILKILPHRYPFLLIDRVLDIKRKERIVPIMPGVLIVEAIAQAGGALLLTEVEDRHDKVMVFTGIERAKFRRPVSPGDQLRLEVEVKGWRVVPGMTAAKMQGYAFVGDRRVAEAAVSCQLIDSSRGRAANDSLDEG
jgi:3-hydroxyacyl-[acyl-carrier-protein] dehydratase